MIIFIVNWAADYFLDQLNVKKCCPKSKYIQFPIINVRRKKQILTFEKLEAVNISCWLKQWIHYQSSCILTFCWLIDFAQSSWRWMCWHASSVMHSSLLMTFFLFSTFNFIENSQIKKTASKQDEKQKEETKCQKIQLWHNKIKGKGTVEEAFYIQ